MVQTASRIAMIALCLCLAASAQSATWYVERDSSGDFIVIQDAVEAAADGDTISIGPGRYDEFVDVVGPAWTEPAVVWVRKDNLVFIGSGVEETRIGPAEYFNPPGVLPKIICAIDDYRASFTNLTIENCREGLYWSYGGFEVSDCAILNCEIGVAAWAEDGASFDNVVFSSESATSYTFSWVSPFASSQPLTI